MTKVSNMSIATPVLIECRLPDGAPGGQFTTFDAGSMFNELRIDTDGRLWTRGLPIDDEPPDDWKPASLSGELCFKEDTGGRREYAALVANGKVEAIRPGWREAWRSQVSSPEGQVQRVLIFAHLLGDGDRPHDQAEWMEAVGLPEPEATKLSWVITAAGDLVASREPRSDHVGWEQSINLVPMPFHGWVFLRDPVSRLPGQAMRFVSGCCQWVVPIHDDGTASAPRRMAELGFPVHHEDQRHQALLAASPVLPTDYSDYGGDAVRWERDTDADHDCSTDCRWFVRLHNDTQDSADADWGVCTNRRSPRCGLLTWEHQAGRGCWEGKYEASNSANVQNR
jgi:hypothetical protein